MNTTLAFPALRTLRPRRCLAPVLVAALLLGGCAAPPSSSPYTVQDADHRDPRRADELNTRAADLIDPDPAQAEALLREALTADLYHGPAHNNLGTLYLSQGKLYEAAGEFEWARKLLPGHPDPRHNLALTFELAGRYDDALATYAAALDVYPEHLPTIQAMVRLQVRASRADERTAAMLDTVAMRGETNEWREWARVERAKRAGSRTP